MHQLWCISFQTCLLANSECQWFKTVTKLTRSLSSWLSVSPKEISFLLIYNIKCCWFVMLLMVWVLNFFANHPTIILPAIPVLTSVASYLRNAKKFIKKIYNITLSRSTPLTTRMTFDQNTEQKRTEPIPLFIADPLSDGNNVWDIATVCKIDWLTIVLITSTTYKVKVCTVYHVLLVSGDTHFQS